MVAYRAVLDDFGGGASVEYLRKDDRKEALGMRAEVRGARRAEARKEEAKVFIILLTVVGTETRVEQRETATRMIYLIGRPLL